MEWGSWANFWAMGGYGLYVWGAYGVTLLAILIEIFLLRRQGRAAIERLRRMKQWDTSTEGDQP